MRRGWRFSSICLALACCWLLSLAWLAASPPHTPRAAAAAPGPFPCSQFPREKAANTAQTITLNHTEGPLGTQLIISGKGWHPGDHVTLHMDLLDTKKERLYRLSDIGDTTIKIGADGSFHSPEFYLDGGACHDDADGRDIAVGDPGTRIYFVATTDAGTVSDPVGFTFTARPTLAVAGLVKDDTAAHPGDTLTVTGKDWAPNTQMRVMLATMSASDGSMTPLPGADILDTTTDAQGSFSASYTIAPSLAWGGYATLVVRGNGQGNSPMTETQAILLLPTVTPTFQANQKTVTPGGTLTISGDHWLPGQNIWILYCRGNGLHIKDGINLPYCDTSVSAQLDIAKADDTGHFQQTVTLPNEARPGVITIAPAYFVDDGTTELNFAPLGVAGANITVAAPQPWEIAHPRLALARNITLVAAIPLVPLLAIGVVWFVRRRTSSPPPLPANREG